jgi:transposase-like protein
MAKKPATLDDVAHLLQFLTAVELWRSGLSQNEIRSRLGIDINTVSKMLKGVSRHVETRTDDAE